MKQISVFLENRPGSLFSVLDRLREWKVNLRALSLADTADFGVLRFIVKDPQTVLEQLKNENFTATLTEVLTVGIADQPGGLSSVVGILTKEGLSIEYLYAFVSPEGRGAYVVLRVEDYDKARHTLENAGIPLLENLSL